MHRFKHDTDFSPLLGSEVVQVCIGQNEVILNLHPVGFLRIEGDWTLAEEGRVVDRWCEFADRTEWRIPALAGRKILGVVVRDDRHLEIQFERATLVIEDDSDHYEAFAVEHPALKLYV